MDNSRENIDFLENEGIFYTLITRWLMLDDDDQAKFYAFIMNNFPKSVTNFNNINSNIEFTPYELGSLRQQSIRFLKLISMYDYKYPIKMDLINLFDETNVSFPDYLYDDDIDFGIEAQSKEDLEFFFMHLFLSMVREYFIILPEYTNTLADEFRKAKPDSFIGWLLSPLLIVLVPLGYLVTRMDTSQENNPKRIADNEYRVQKAIRDLEKEFEKRELLAENKR